MNILVTGSNGQLGSEIKDLAFNYGTFDFNTPNFYIKFGQGKLPYALSVSTYDDFLRNYISEKRWIKQQKLDITYGENKDVTSYINEWGNMHKAMAVLFRPIKQKQGHKYLIEEYEGSHKYSEVMKQMPLSVVLGAMVFFYNLTNELLNYIPSYLEKELLKEQTIGQISQENGEVIQNYIHLLKETLRDLKKLQSFPFTNV